jgi:hypothetical protein
LDTSPTISPTISVITRERIFAREFLDDGSLISRTAY